MCVYSMIKCPIDLPFLFMLSCIISIGDLFLHFNPFHLSSIHCVFSSSCHHSCTSSEMLLLIFSAIAALIQFPWYNSRNAQSIFFYSTKLWWEQQRPFIFIIQCSRILLIFHFLFYFSSSFSCQKLLLLKWRWIIWDGKLNYFSK